MFAVMAATVATNHADRQQHNVSDLKASKESAGSYAQALANPRAAEPTPNTNGVCGASDSGQDGEAAASNDELGLNRNMVHGGPSASTNATVPARDSTPVSAETTSSSNGIGAADPAAHGARPARAKDFGDCALPKVNPWTVNRNAAHVISGKASTEPVDFGGTVKPTRRGECSRVPRRAFWGAVHQLARVVRSRAKRTRGKSAALAILPVAGPPYRALVVCLLFCFVLFLSACF